jgi:hypothetical protein
MKIIGFIQILVGFGFAILLFSNAAVIAGNEGLSLNLALYLPFFALSAMAVWGGFLLTDKEYRINGAWYSLPVHALQIPIISTEALRYHFILGPYLRLSEENIRSYGFTAFMNLSLEQSDTPTKVSINLAAVISTCLLLG